jgi:flagellar basal body rod protein FlgC
MPIIASNAFGHKKQNMPANPDTKATIKYRVISASILSINSVPLESISKNIANMNDNAITTIKPTNKRDNDFIKFFQSPWKREIAIAIAGYNKGDSTIDPIIMAGLSMANPTKQIVVAQMVKTKKSKSYRAKYSKRYEYDFLISISVSFVFIF